MNCPICLQDGVIEKSVKDEVHEMQCRWCGQYYVEDSLMRYRDPLREFYDDRHFLSGEARNRADQGNPITFDKESIKAVVRLRRGMSVSDRLNRLLYHIASHSPYPGHRLGLSHIFDYPVCHARNADEFGQFLRHLVETGFVSWANGMCILTVPGWERYEELQKSSIASNQAFVAMSFHDDLKDLYNQGIEPAILKAEYSPLVMWKLEHVEKIDDRIIVEIRKSRFMVADFTLQRGGVYFEAGYAHALGLPVIWLCRKDEEEQLHFDTSHFNHIFWRKPEDVVDSLYYRIKAVVG
ncbi:MAG TPA: hypothetical protein VGL40_06895 [Bacillota bacterium]